MALLDEIGTRLANSTLASSSGAGGWTLIKSWLPDSTALPDKLVALIETPGVPGGARTDIDRPGFQVLVRGNAIQESTGPYTDARTQAQSIKDDLHAMANTTLSGRYFVGCLAQQDPFLLEYDQQGRPIIACNYIAWRSRA